MLETRRGRGRPPIDNPKSRWLRVRVTEDEFGKVRESSTRIGCTESEMIRRLVKIGLQRIQRNEKNPG